MKKYFYSNGAEKLGPFTLDELKDKNIKPNTLMWSEGMPNWQEARAIEELKALLKLGTPPPLPFTTPHQNQPVVYPIHTKSKNDFGFTTGIIVGVCVLLVAGAIYISQNNSRQNTNTSTFGSSRAAFVPEREKTQEEIKIDLKSKEEAEPLKYLSLSYDVREAFDGRTRITGRVSNKASVAKFKDVVIRMTFYTKTDTEIDTEEKTVVEFLAPNSAKNFNWKIATPRKTAKVSLQIIDVAIVAPSVEF